jgi:hypothetical protein
MVSPVIVLKGGTPNLSVQERRLNPFAICSFVSSLLPLLLFGALMSVTLTLIQSHLNDG